MNIFMKFQRLLYLVRVHPATPPALMADIYESIAKRCFNMLGDKEQEQVIDIVKGLLKERAIVEYCIPVKFTVTGTYGCGPKGEDDVYTVEEFKKFCEAGSFIDFD